MAQKNLSWVETFHEVMSRELPPKNTAVEVAFFVREPSKEEVDSLLEELDALGVQIEKR